MPLRTIFVTVGWGYGKVVFADKKKLVLMSTTNAACLEAAVKFTRETAERVAKSHFGEPVDCVVGKLYFEIFNSKEDGVASIFRSENSPEE